MRFKNTLLQYKSAPQWVYHGTDRSELDSIAAHGLEGSGPEPDYRVWPEFEGEGEATDEEIASNPELTEPRVYATGNLNRAQEYAGHDGAILRMPLSLSGWQLGAIDPSDVYRTETIPAGAIQVLGGDGQWHSMTQVGQYKQAGNTDTEELDAYDSELARDLMAVHDEVNLHPNRDFDARNERAVQRYYNYTLRAARTQLIPAIAQAAKQSKRQKDIEELIEDAEGKLQMAEHYGGDGLYLKTTSFLEDALSYLHDAIDIVRQTTRNVPAVRTYRPMQPAWGAR